MPGDARGSLPDVTVIVTTYDGAARIETCLASLARQTLAPERFEVLVVQNGPACATPGIVGRFAREHPALHLRLLELRRGGLGHARNVGLLAARGRYVTYLDDDDWFSDDYLAAMLAHAAPDVVPVALVSAQSEGVVDQGLDLDNYASRNLLRRAGKSVASDQLVTALNYNAGKLVATDLARQVEYDESLRSGEDVVYWASLLALRPFTMHALTIAENAVYCRLMRQGSVGNQDASYDFLVTQRLACLRALEAIPAGDRVSRRVNAALVRGQGSWINDYLREHPDHHARVVADARAAGLRRLPWAVINRGLARCLLLRSGQLRPADIEAVRRLASQGVLIDAISDSDDWSEILKPVEMNRVLARRWASPPAPEVVGPRSLANARAVVESWEADQPPHQHVVTVGSAPFANDLAEMLIQDRPELLWEGHAGGGGEPESGCPAG